MTASLRALGYRTPHELYFGTKAAFAPASEAEVCDMDRIAIVVCRSNGEAVFPGFPKKLAFGHRSG
ncbi:MAG TPA: hypothetical protein VMW46_00635 [Candidatus Desulfaltia sp.]|nr:hypothetical protein [Candidatus Desulfaltia sp.]